MHDLALTFSSQHNKSYEAYERMSDSLMARMHTLELGQPNRSPMDEPALDPEDHQVIWMVPKNQQWIWKHPQKK